MEKTKRETGGAENIEKKLSIIIKKHLQFSKQSERGTADVIQSTVLNNQLMLLLQTVVSISDPVVSFAENRSQVFIVSVVNATGREKNFLIFFHPEKLFAAIRCIFRHFLL